MRLKITLAISRKTRLPAVLALVCLFSFSATAHADPEATSSDKSPELEQIGVYRNLTGRAEELMAEAQRQRREPERFRRRREALDLLYKASMIVATLPAATLGEAGLEEAVEQASQQLDDLRKSPEMVSLGERTLEEAISLYRAEKLEEALFAFDEYRMLTPGDEAVLFMVDYLNRRVQN